MKKIIVDKNEGIAEVIDRILNEPDTEIIVVIPRGSALGKTARNFHLLKREADGAGRAITIESVDETILAFAKESKIDASHPLWRGVRGSGGLSDIVPKDELPEREEAEEAEEEVAEKERTREVVRIPVSSSKKQSKKPVIIREPEHEKDIEDEDTAEGADGEGDEDGEKKSAEERRAAYVSEFGDDDEGGGSWISGKAVWWGAGAILVVIIGIFGLNAIFNRADVTINFKKTPWTFQNNFVADKSASVINAAGNVIPAQIFSNNKNTTQSFHASSVSDVSTRAHGTVTIYNAYNSSKQELVATTRFLTPDGKIFRLVSNVTVPGAQVTDGKITPSSIDAAVVADQAGPSYNVGPIAHLTIPGFQGTPRADGFYGAMTGAATGGFTGQHAVPTAADIAAAKASTTAMLQADLSSGLTNSYPNNFKILDGATTVQLSKLTVNTSTDANGNFTVFAEGVVQAVGFDESALKVYLLSLAQSTEANSTFSDLTLSYSNVSANFPKGQVSFALSAQGSLEPAFSTSDFTTSILGKSISDARQAILNLPQLADGKISVWPLWLWDIPSNPAKVHVTAN